MSERVAELEAAVDRVRRMHPRGDEDSGRLEPGVWCPGCGEPRNDNGFGGCRTRRALDGTPDFMRAATQDAE